MKLLIEQIAQITERIQSFYKEIGNMADEAFLETKALTRVFGAGTLTAVTSLLTVGDKHRFSNSHVVGSYVALRPRRDQSGSHDPQLEITKAGNKHLRNLLIEYCNQILGPFGRGSALRHWELQLIAC